jgi:hypothetical protein
MFHLVCALSAISPTPDITGPVVGASPRIGKEHKCEFWAFIAIFFPGVSRLGYGNDVIRGGFVNIGILLHIARLDG